MLLLCGTAYAGHLQSSAADLDRDGRTDVIVLKSEPASGTRTRYSLEIFSGGKTAPVRLSEFEAAWQSRIVVRDIDGDRDSDLLLLSAAGYAIRAWINDGAGHLTVADVAQPACPEDPTTLDGPPSPTPLNRLFAPGGSGHVLTQPSEAGMIATTEKASPLPSAPHIRATLRFALFTRPPPVRSLQ